jgi:hypothetical protein
VLRGLVNGWNRLRETRLSLDDIAGFCQRYTKLNIGVLGGCGGLVPIDFDTDDAGVLAACDRALPRPNVAKVGRRGFVGFYRAAGELPRARKFVTRKRDGKPGKVLVEILTSTKTVLPPSIHPDTREPYRWLTRGTLYSKPVTNLAPITAEHIEALAAALRPWCPPPPSRKYREIHPGEIVADDRIRAYALGALRGTTHRLAAAGRGGRRMALFDGACQLGVFVNHKVLTSGEVVPALLDACKRNGLLADDGEHACIASIKSGFSSRIAHSGLPALQYWGRSTR